MPMPYDFFVYKIFIHNKGQMNLMSEINIFGSEPLTVGKPGEGANSKTFKLSQIHWIAKDQKDQRCDEENTIGNTSKCITAFLEREIGCSMNLQESGHDSNV